MSKNLADLKCQSTVYLTPGVVLLPVCDYFEGPIPLDPATEVGPLIHERHVEKVLSYVNAARKDGATIAAGSHAWNGIRGSRTYSAIRLLAVRSVS